MSQTEENIKILSDALPNSLTENELDIIKRVSDTYNELIQYPCTSCKYCLPCPQNIDVAAVTKYLDMAKSNDSEIVRSHYNALSAHGGDCAGCGSCEGNCPFNVKIIENMKEAKQVFGM
jgi:predicted aldo/keto reductase-like oxidoreductase